MTSPMTWLPACILAVGLFFTHLSADQQTRQLRVPLDEAVPSELSGWGSVDIPISEDELRVAGPSDYLMRVFGPEGAVDELAFTLYVGYYASQARGRTIHSPKNCLPGAGWEPLTSQREVLAGRNGPLPVNRYLLQRGQHQALVLYWYQGRGRTEASEYRVKWNLLRDAALQGRSDEALVRVMIPITTTEEDAFRTASAVATQVEQSIRRSLPT